MVAQVLAPSFKSRSARPCEKSLILGQDLAESFWNQTLNDEIPVHDVDMKTFFGATSNEHPRREVVRHPNDHDMLGRRWTPGSQPENLLNSSPAQKFGEDVQWVFFGLDPIQESQMGILLSNNYSLSGKPQRTSKWRAVATASGPMAGAHNQHQVFAWCDLYWHRFYLQNDMFSIKSWCNVHSSMLFAIGKLR